MPKFFIKQEQMINDKITIQGEDVNHIKNVLRKKIGDSLTICNLQEQKDYLCAITSIEKEWIECKIQEELDEQVESKIKVSILQGLPKADKMELIIQKSVELGVFEITPITMKRCVVKLQEKEQRKKLERWQKISEVAAKQCGRNVIPTIHPITSLKNICQKFQEYDIVLIAYEKEDKTTLKQVLEKIKKQVETKQEEQKIAILIGPEGGIADEEVEMLKENGAITTTLGKRILRTETVALNMLSIIMYELEN